ncbi:MAG: methyltransferase [Streptosporangiaceae bacterium]|nr:methyltransferase [Streptosporangiaceae bacterium]
MTAEEFVLAATEPGAVPFVPEITLRMAADPFGLWERTEVEWAGREWPAGGIADIASGRATALPPPFWAFPWAGGQGLARYVLDNPGTVAGRAVLDMASGSGLVAIAAAKAGAARVTATDIDPLALSAVRVNAAANHVAVTVRSRDVRAGGGGGEAPEVVLVADAFYERDLAEQTLALLRRAEDGGARVMLADPGRAFLPTSELTAIAEYEIPVVAALENADSKRVTVYGLRC